MSGKFLVCVFLVCTNLPADIIRLNSGGEIRGEFATEYLNDVAPIEMVTLNGARIILSRSVVDFAQKRSRVEEEYISKSREINHTVNDHWELADWCRTHLLNEQRQEQLELLLEIDPDHKQARKILGHVQHQGEWMPREEMMTLRGYVKHKGKWITQLEKDLLDKNTAIREAELVWYPKVRLWYAWITGKNIMRKQDGLKEFHSIRDPAAIPALKKIIGTHDDVDVRLLFVEIVSQLHGRSAIQELLERYLFDSNEVVRQHAIDSLKVDQFQQAVPMLISALRNDGNVVINRAARVLGQLNNPQAVPHLIDALVTSHKYKVNVPTGNAMSFASGPNGVSTTSPYGGSLPPEVEAMARTGQFPYGAQVIQHPATPRLSKTVTVKVEQKNPEVLKALQQLTGKNYGFNERDWQLWWSIEKG